MKNLDKLKAQYEQLGKEIEALEKPVGRRKPEVGEWYWTATTRDVTTCNWRNDDIDNFRWLMGLVFFTEEEAEQWVTNRKVHVRLQELAEYWKPDWSDELQSKYFLEYAHDSKRIEWGWEYRYQRANTVYFKEKSGIEALTAQIDSEFGEGALKTYLTS
jgi:hypothetical protein